MESREPIQSEEQPSSASIHVRVVYLSNKTTHVELRDGQRIFGEKVEKKKKVEAHAIFVELMEKGFKLDIPPRTCSVGHRLEFELEIKAPQQTLRFQAQGVVEQSEVFPHSHDNIAVGLTQYDRILWGDILRLYQNHQNQTTDLFNRLKGFDP